MASIVDVSGLIVGGVDTHRDSHSVAALDSVGGLLGTNAFKTDNAGYGRLLVWLRSYGTVDRVGVEGTGSYGAGLARFLTDQVPNCGRCQ